MPDRIQGTLDPVEILADRPGELQALEDRQQAAQPPPAAATNPDPAASADALAQLRQQCKSFESSVATKLKTAIDQMKVARDGRSGRSGLYARYLRERMKYRNEQVPQLTAQGEIVEGAMDAHLKTGTTLGLFAANVNTTTASLTRLVLGGGADAWALEPLGLRQENQQKLEVVKRLVERQLELAKADGQIAQALMDLAQHGSCVMRQAWCEESRWVRTDARTYAEKTIRRGTTLRHWPLIDAWVSNPQCPWAEDQDAVVWYSRQPLSFLERDERRLVLENKVRQSPLSGMIEPTMSIQARGRFINLEQMRRGVMETPTGSEFREQGIMTTQGPVETSQRLPNRPGRVSAETVNEVYEFQGWYPIGDEVRTGKLTLDMLRQYGIDLRVEPADDQGEAAPPDSIEALARLCDRLVWYISVAMENKSSDPVLIEFQPCPYREPRTELVSGFFVPTGEFYGMSADTLGADVGDAADAVLNDIVEILHDNANPKRAVNKSAIGEGTETDEQLRKMIFGRGEEDIIWIGKNQVKVVDVIQYLNKPYDASFAQLLDRLIEIYNKRALSNETSQGAPATTETDTLGEAQLQQQGEQLRLSDIALRLSSVQLVVPIVENVLRDLDWFLSPEELQAEAQRLGGLPALDWDAIFPDAEAEGPGHPSESLFEQFAVKSAAQAAMDRAVTVNFIMQLKAAWIMDPAFNSEGAGREAARIMGLDGDKFFSIAGGALSPRKEFDSILAGDRPSVQPQEDSLNTHLPQHQQQMQTLQMLLLQAQTEGKDTTAIDGWIATLKSHLLDTIDNAQRQMAMMQQAAMEQAQAQPPGGGQKPGQKPGQPGSNGSANGNGNGKSAGGNDKPLQPRDHLQIARGLQTNAHKTPRAVGGQR